MNENVGNATPQYTKYIIAGVVSILVVSGLVFSMISYKASINEKFKAAENYKNKAIASGVVLEAIKVKDSKVSRIDYSMYFLNPIFLNQSFANQTLLNQTLASQSLPNQSIELMRLQGVHPLPKSKTNWYTIYEYINPESKEYETISKPAKSETSARGSKETLEICYSPLNKRAYFVDSIEASCGSPSN